MVPREWVHWVSHLGKKEVAGSSAQGRWHTETALLTLTLCSAQVQGLPASATGDLKWPIHSVSLTPHPNCCHLPPGRLLYILGPVPASLPPSSTQPILHQ